MNRSLISPASSSCFRFRAASVGLVVLTLSFAALFVAVSADAACGDPRERGSGSILQLPLVIASQGRQSTRKRRARPKRLYRRLVACHDFLVAMLFLLA
jgi:hypothetical protein